MVELHVLMAFKKVAEEQSITRAAVQLGISQPALSVKLQNLESTLGQKLFTRHGRGVRLTDAGRIFYQYVDQAISLLKMAVDAVRHAETAHISVGCISSLAVSCLSSAVSEMKNLYPDIRVSVYVGDSGNVHQFLLSGVIGVGITARYASGQGIESVPLATDPIVLVAGRDHPLAAEDGEVPVSSLVEHNLVLANWGSGYDVFLGQLRGHLGHYVDYLPTMNLTHTAVEMTKRGLVVSFLPYTVVAEQLERENLKAISVKDLSLPERQIFAIFKNHDQKLQAPVNTFIDLMKSVVRSTIHGDDDSGCDLENPNERPNSSGQ